MSRTKKNKITKKHELYNIKNTKKTNLNRKIYNQVQMF